MENALLRRLQDDAIKLRTVGICTEKNKIFFGVFVKGDSILSSRLLKLFVFAANLLGHDPSDSRVCRNALQRNATSVAI